MIGVIVGLLVALTLTTCEIVWNRFEILRLRLALAAALVSESLARGVVSSSKDAATLRSDEYWRTLLTGDVAGHA